jgi:hypothetical protein
MDWLFFVIAAVLFGVPAAAVLFDTFKGFDDPY